MNLTSKLHRPPNAAEPECLNCGAPLLGAYCAACGQPAVDLRAPTWHVVRDALADATDMDGRVLRTARALAAPGRLTAEFLRGRRTPYLGPVKLFLLAGTALTATWIVTRGVDTHYYGLPPAGAAAATYIDTVVRALVAATIAVAVSNWALGAGRRRLLDEAVFALHLVAAVSVGAAGVIWLGTLWKLVWGTAAVVPNDLPSLPYLLFLLAGAVGLPYITVAVRRVYGNAWWVAALRALALAAVGFAAVTGAILVGYA